MIKSSFVTRHLGLLQLFGNHGSKFGVVPCIFTIPWCTALRLAMHLLPDGIAEGANAKLIPRS
jgi:hypothetical protein